MGGLTQEELKNLQSLLQALEKMHKILDVRLYKCIELKICNFIEIQKLKKRKLHIKDQISDLQSKINPDIIA